MQRGTLLGWAVGTAVFGFCLGVAADEFQAMIADNPAAADVIAAMGGGGRLVDTYFAAVLGLFALAFGAYVVQALLRIRADESEGVLEAVLATAVGRSRWLGTHLAAAVLGALALLLVAGAGTGLGYGVVAGDVPGRVLALAGAAAVWLPALVVVAGVVIAFVGLLPRWSVGLSWAALLSVPAARADRHPAGTAAARARRLAFHPRPGGARRRCGPGAADLPAGGGGTAALRRRGGLPPPRRAELTVRPRLRAFPATRPPRAGDPR